MCLMRHQRICVDCMMLVVDTMRAIAVGVSAEASARVNSWPAAPSFVPNTVPRHVLICLIHMIKGGAMNVASHATSAASIAAVKAPATQTVTTGTGIIVAEDY